MRAAIVALLVTLPFTAASAQTADTVLFNGKVATVDKDFSVREAIAISNGRVLANGASAAMKKLGGKLERDADNKPTGAIAANGNALGKLFDKLPKPTPAQQADGTKAFFREMNALGITGIIDGGGVSMYPSSYQALFKVWHDKEL